jgi:hypothetical protein
MVDAHISDLRREAERARTRAAALRARRQNQDASDFQITIRRATESDEPGVGVPRRSGLDAGTGESRAARGERQAVESAVLT